MRPPPVAAVTAGGNMVEVVRVSGEEYSFVMPEEAVIIDVTFQSTQELEYSPLKKRLRGASFFMSAKHLDCISAMPRAPGRPSHAPGPPA